MYPIPWKVIPRKWAGRGGTDSLRRGSSCTGPADLRALESLPAQRFPEEEAILDTYRDLTHFLQIPSGDGDMEWYDFPLDTFLTRFQKNATTTLYALKALEQEALVLYSDRVNLPAMCHLHGIARRSGKGPVRKSRIGAPRGSPAAKLPGDSPLSHPHFRRTPFADHEAP